MDAIMTATSIDLSSLVTTLSGTITVAELVTIMGRYPCGYGSLYYHEKTCYQICKDVYWIRRRWRQKALIGKQLNLLSGGAGCRLLRAKRTRFTVLFARRSRQPEPARIIYRRKYEH